MWVELIGNVEKALGATAAVAPGSWRENVILQVRQGVPLGRRQGRILAAACRAKTGPLAPGSFDVFEIEVVCSAWIACVTATAFGEPV